MTNTFPYTIDRVVAVLADGEFDIEFAIRADAEGAKTDQMALNEHRAWLRDSGYIVSTRTFRTPLEFDDWCDRQN